LGYRFGDGAASLVVSVSDSSVVTPLPIGATKALTVQQILNLERARVDRSSHSRPG